MAAPALPDDPPAPQEPHEPLRLTSVPPAVTWAACCPGKDQRAVVTDEPADAGAVASASASAMAMLRLLADRWRRSSAQSCDTWVPPQPPAAVVNDRSVC